MKAYTDASVSSDGTVHSYIVYDDTGNVIMKETLKSGIQDSMRAEMASIAALLIKFKDKSMKNITIYTDCKAILTCSHKSKKIGHIRSWIEDILNNINSNLKWVKRDMNTIADKMCCMGRKIIDKLDDIDLRDAFETVKYKAGNLVEYDKHLHYHLGRLKANKDRVRKGTSSGIEVINEEFSEEDVKQIYNLYCTLVNKKYRYDIEEVIGSAKDKTIHQRGLLNTKRGRCVLVEKFIEKHHKTVQINRKMIKHSHFTVYNPYPLQLKEVSV